MDNSAFSKPQRQSIKGIVLLSALNFIKVLRNFWPLYLIAFFKGDNGNFWFLWIISGFSFLYFTILSYLQYINFSFFINSENGEFVIEKGIVNKKRISIEKNKIQEVNLNQPFLHRLLRIYKLEIDTSGLDKKEFSIEAISYELAQELRNYLLENKISIRQSVQQETQTEEHSKRIRISVLSILKYSISANYARSFSSLIAFGFYLIHNVLDVLKYNEFNEYEGVLKQRVQDIPFQDIGVVLVVLAVILAIIINVVLSLVRYFGMEISEKQNRLSLQYGLFHKKNSIISGNKVQIITETQNYFQKKMNVLQLKFNQISEDEFDKNSYSVIPGCNKEEKNELIRFLWKNVPQFESFLKPNFRKLVPSHLLFIVVPIMLAFWAKSYFGPYFYVVYLYVIVVETLLLLSFYHSKFLFNDGFIQVQSGSWDIQKKTIEIDKIQMISLSQYVWQKKTNLGSIRIHTAGGEIAFKTTNYSTLKKIMNYCLFKVEYNNK